MHGKWKNSRIQILHFRKNKTHQTSTTHILLVPFGCETQSSTDTCLCCVLSEAAKSTLLTRLRRTYRTLFNSYLCGGVVKAIYVHKRCAHREHNVCCFAANDTQERQRFFFVGTCVILRACYTKKVPTRNIRNESAMTSIRAAGNSLQHVFDQEIDESSLLVVAHSQVCTTQIKVNARATRRTSRANGVIAYFATDLQ